MEGGRGEARWHSVGRDGLIVVEIEVEVEVEAELVVAAVVSEVEVCSWREGW
jgi:hypothetical protein